MIFISIVTSDVEHLCMYLFAIYIYFLVKSFFMPFAHFLLGLFVLLLVLSVESSLYFLNISSLSDM